MAARRTSRSPADAGQFAAAVEQCACFNFRKASRAITQLYDDALQPAGLRSTQLVILLSIAASDEPPTIAQLAREMVMDPSTLNRNLQPLSRRRLIRRTTSRDGRRKLLALTEKGLAAIAEAVPLWEKAQGQFVEQIGADRWDAMRHSMRSVVEAARLA